MSIKVKDADRLKTLLWLGVRNGGGQLVKTLTNRTATKITNSRKTELVQKLLTMRPDQAEEVFYTVMKKNFDSLANPPDGAAGYLRRMGDELARYPNIKRALNAAYRRYITDYLNSNKRMN